MRCWVGNEVEHNLNYPNKTLFIESSIIDFKTVSQLINNLSQNYDFDSIYLGAGEVDVVSFFNLDYITLLAKYNVVIECTPENLNFIVDSVGDFVYNCIVRFQTTLNDLSKISLKIRNDNEVEVCNYNKNNSNSLKESKDNLYSTTDVVVFNNEGEMYEDLSCSY